jgi:hypothetical protein
MDVGVIKCFKAYYRTRMARFLINVVCENQYEEIKQNSVKFNQAIDMAVLE